jgi:hypothetical protein
MKCSSPEACRTENRGSRNRSAKTDRHTCRHRGPSASRRRGRRRHRIARRHCGSRAQGGAARPWCRLARATGRHRQSPRLRQKNFARIQACQNAPRRGAERFVRQHRERGLRPSVAMLTSGILACAACASTASRRRSPKPRVASRGAMPAATHARATSVAARRRPSRRSWRSRGRGAVRYEHFIGGIGEVAERIDERAVKVEDEQPDHSVYSANDVGVSHSVTRTTGSPSLAACW